MGEDKALLGREKKLPRGLVQGCFSLNSLFLGGTPLFGVAGAIRALAARDLGVEVLRSASTIPIFRKQDFVVLA